MCSLNNKFLYAVHLLVRVLSYFYTILFYPLAIYIISSAALFI